MNKARWIGFAVLLLFAVAALIGPLLVSSTPFEIDADRFLPPSDGHWLGTNSLGQDVFSGLVYGARTTLLVGLCVSLLSTLLSGLLGLIAGYSRRLDPVLNALANMLLVLPPLLLILIVASFTGGGTWQLILTLGLLTWPSFMRLIRASVLSLKEREFVKASRLFGGGTFYVLRHHLLPFLWPLLRTKFILSFRQAVTIEASLAFIGIGDANRPSWGKMLQQAFSRNETWISDVWQWTVLPPTLAVLLVTVGLALAGEEKSAEAALTKAGSPRGRKAAQAAFGKAAAAAKPGARADAGAPSAGAARSGQAPAAAGQAGVPPRRHCALAADRLSVEAGGRAIVRGVSFALPAGSVAALIGESGSGKTTLARALYGLLPAEALKGEAWIAGRPIYGIAEGPAMKRWTDAAFIFQDPRQSFNPLLTLGAQFSEAMRRNPAQGREGKKAAQAAAAAALREVQLDPKLLGSYPHELSGGMLSRALIALALINRPGVLIADEPTGALDPIVKREILELLTAKVREHGMTLLLITHDLQAAEAVADRILTLAGGELTEDRRVERKLG